MINKNLTIALIVSVIINLFLIGVGTGMWFSKNHPHGGLYDAFKHPPKDLSPEIRQLFKQKHEAVRQNFKEIRKIKQQIHDEIVAPELDINKLRELFDKMNELRSQSASASQQAMFEALEHMTFEERQQLAQDMDQRKPGRFRR